MQVAKNFTIGEKIKAKKYFSNIHANVRKFVDSYQKDRLTNYLYWKVESNANDVEVECSRKLYFTIITILRLIHYFMQKKTKCKIPILQTSQWNRKWFFKFHFMIYHLSLANPHVWLAIQNDQIIYKIVDDNSIKIKSI